MTLKQGRHSRFRKDLVNLNKAVIKWLRQEDEGLISHLQVLERIKNSHVAVQLKDVHGQEFDEGTFVQDTLNRAQGSSALKRGR